MRSERHATYARLAGVVLIWGVNWLVLAYVLRTIGPVSFTALRFAGAVCVMTLLAVPLREALLPLPAERVPLAMIGLWQMAAMQGLSTLGLRFLAPGRAAVLAYTMQLWAIPLGWLIAREPVSGRAVLGGAVGFAGVLVFLNPSLVNWRDGGVVLGHALLIASGLSWAIGASLYRRRAWRSSLWTQTSWQLGWSALALAPFALRLEGFHAVGLSFALFAALVFNWLIATALAYWWWGRALTVLPAPVAGQIVALVPVVALLASATLAGERVDAGVVASLVLIGAGITLTLRARARTG